MIFNNKIVSFINQNRNIIIIVIAICVFIILLIKTLNGFVLNTSDEEETSNVDNITKEIQSSRETITSNTTVDKKAAKDNYNLISSFVELCNNR